MYSWDGFQCWWKGREGEEGGREESTHHAGKELIEIIMGHFVANTDVGG